MTSVPCERGFSVRNRVRTKVRSRLTDKHVVQHMRVQANKIPLDECDLMPAMNHFLRHCARRPTGRINNIPAEDLKLMQQSGDQVDVVADDVDSLDY